MKIFSILLASITASVALAQDPVPTASCGFFKQAQCAASLATLVYDINSLPLPPTVDHVKAVLLNGQSFIAECKDCMYGSQTTLLCDTVGSYVEKAGDVVGLDVDFDAATCKSEGIVVAVTDLVKLYLPGNVGIMPVPQPKKVGATISDGELKDLEKVYNELYKGKTDAPSKEKLYKIVLDMASRPEVEGGDTSYGILASPCEVGVAIDAIALGLSAIGLKGSSGKSIARKMYNKLPPHAQKQLIRIVKTIKMNNFANKIYDVVELVYNNLSWNALKDTFSELGYWDAASFALSFAGIFATGGTAFLLNVGLLTYDVTLLVIAINDCFF